MAELQQDFDLLNRMVRAVEKVKERLQRAAALLEGANVPYAVVGGNAVATWVASIDEAAVRNTRDVDILLRREDLEAAKNALNPGGFIFRHVKGIDMFLDGPHAKAGDAVHVLFANEKVKDTDPMPAPEVTESELAVGFRVLSLEALVRMKLTAYRRKDQVHIQDLIGVGLINESWLERVPTELAPRLKELLDDPEG